MWGWRGGGGGGGFDWPESESSLGGCCAPSHPLLHMSVPGTNAPSSCTRKILVLPPVCLITRVAGADMFRTLERTTTSWWTCLRTRRCIVVLCTSAWRASWTKRCVRCMLRPPGVFLEAEKLRGLAPCGGGFCGFGCVVTSPGWALNIAYYPHPHPHHPHPHPHHPQPHSPPPPPLPIHASARS